jgi:hypothetical protein
MPKSWEALQIFGTPLSQMQVEDFSTPEIVDQIGLDELLKNKESSGRDKDTADIPTIKQLLGKAKTSL